MPKDFEFGDSPEVSRRKMKQAYDRMPIFEALQNLIELYGATDVLWAFSEFASFMEDGGDAPPGAALPKSDREFWKSAARDLMSLTDRAMEIGL
jgi:hypothetical protein